MRTRRWIGLLLLSVGVGCGGGSSGGGGGADAETGGTGGGSDGEGGAKGGGSGGAGGEGGTAPAGAGGAAAGGSAGASAGAGGRAGGAGTGGAAGAAAGSGGTVVPSGTSGKPAVARGGDYRGFAERFNRYYTDPAYKPATTIYVSPTGGGNGATRGAPTTVTAGINAAAPGTQIVFTTGTYNGCFEFDNGKSGTYDAPIVLFAERGAGGARGVVINCCASGRRTCINLEAANYVAVDGFELVGGDYGVRAVGADYAAPMHQRGIAVLNVDGHDQQKDPFLTGASDWYVIERVLAHNAGAGDGHGIYLSNGSDWNIVRFNELWNNATSDFQINADPASTCADINIAFNSPECDAVAGTPGNGGRGASDFMLIEGNFFHHGLGQGANFTSVRNSIVRNNIFAFYARHGVSFWQETDNPKLGSSDNQVFHNLFVANVANRQMVQFIVNSDRNSVFNNLFVGVGANMLAMEVDGTVGANSYAHNYYMNARLSGRTAGANEHINATFNAAWWKAWPAALTNDVTAFEPAANAPFLNLGDLLPSVAIDRAGKSRTAPTDLGPFER